MLTYLEACKEAVSSINIGQLAALPLGESVGQDGHSYGFRQVGKITVASVENTPVGIKIPKMRVAGAWFDVCHAIGFISAASIKAPELLDYVPSFVGLVEVEDSATTAVITEDVSGGGQKGVFPQAVSQDVRALLARTFGESSFHSEACHKSVSFDVDGEEKLLDLTPPPIEFGVLQKSEIYNASRGEVEDALTELTVTLPKDSALGISIGSIALA